MALSWGGKQFANVQQFAQWLAAHGTNLAAFSANHPGAMAQLGGTYENAIASEPIYAQQRAQQQADVTSAAAARQAAIRNAYAGYGGALPADFTDKYGDLLPDAQSGVDPRKIAAENAYSDTALLNRRFGDPNAAPQTGAAIGSDAGLALAQLSARGAMGSGAEYNRLQDIGFNAGLERQKALQGFLSTIGTQDSTFAGVVNDNANKNVTAMQDAMQRLIKAGFSPAAAAAAVGSSGAARAAATPAVARAAQATPGPASAGQVAAGTAMGVNAAGGTVKAGALAPGLTQNPDGSIAAPNGINPGATFAKPFDYGSIKAGYTNPINGKRILDPSITGTSYDPKFLAQSQAAAAKGVNARAFALNPVPAGGR